MNRLSPYILGDCILYGSQFMYTWDKIDYCGGKTSIILVCLVLPIFTYLLNPHMESLSSVYHMTLTVSHEAGRNYDNHERTSDLK